MTGGVRKEHFIPKVSFKRLLISCAAQLSCAIYSCLYLYFLKFGLLQFGVKESVTKKMMDHRTSNCGVKNTYSPAVKTKLNLVLLFCNNGRQQICPRRH